MLKSIISCHEIIRQGKTYDILWKVPKPSAVFLGYIFRHYDSKSDDEIGCWLNDDSDYDDKIRFQFDLNNFNQI